MSENATLHILYYIFVNNQWQDSKASLLESKEMHGTGLGVGYPYLGTTRSASLSATRDFTKSNRNYGVEGVLCQKNDIFGSISDIPCKVVQVQVGKNTMPILTADCDYVMEMYISAGMDDRDPYWTCIWPSSQVLAAAVLGQGKEIVRGKRVADFGAGLGLAGVASALANAEEVVFLDREPLALECCLVNSYIHGCLPSSSYARELAHSLGQHNISNNHIGKTKIDAQLFDWNEEVQGPNLHGFDVILVCDCLYEKFSVEPIARVLPLLLKKNGGKILLADPPNRARANRDKFLGLMACSGLKIEEERVMTTLENHQGGTREVQIVYMTLSR